jgi:hypothetical protein
LWQTLFCKIYLVCEGQLMEDDMKTGLKLALAAGIGLGALGLGGKSVSALPITGLDPALATPADIAKRVNHVRRVHSWHRRYWWCGPGYGFYSPGPWWRYSYGYYPWRTMGGYWPYRYGYYC